MATKDELFQEIEEIDESAVEGKTKDDFTHQELEDLLSDVKEAADDQEEDSDDQDSEDEETPPAKTKLDKMVEDKKSEVTGVIGNARKEGPVRVGGVFLAPKGKKMKDPATDKEVGDKHTLTAAQKNDKNLIAKIVRNVARGLLEWR